VRLRQAERVPGEGCPGGFFLVAPRGYVCNDRTVTLDRDTAFLRADAHTRPRPGPYPYDYAISSGAPMYARVPTAREQQRTEWRYGPVGVVHPLPLFQRGHEHLATTAPIVPVDPLPDFLAGGGTARGEPVFEVLERTIPHGSMLSYTRAFDVAGRTFLLSADLTVVPADRVRRFERSTFHGVELGNAVALPLAFFRAVPRPQYRLAADGSFARLEARWPVHGWVKLTGRSVERDGERYLEVAGGDGRGPWTAASDATVVTARDKLPFGVRPGEKWIIISITEGTLVAYEDLRPVYATLISPGRGGIPRKGGDLVKDSTTPLGGYRITFKDRAATMAHEMGEDRSSWIADVPFTQYFRAPFALHGAYWHDQLGEPMSTGCVNASLPDAHWLFEWTDPPVPEGWQGATGTRDNGPTTRVIVTR
jgi:hypothetical protein